MQTNVRTLALAAFGAVPPTAPDVHRPALPLRVISTRASSRTHLARYARDPCTFRLL